MGQQATAGPGTQEAGQCALEKHTGTGMNRPLFLALYVEPSMKVTEVEPKLGRRLREGKAHPLIPPSFTSCSRAPKDLPNVNLFSPCCLLMWPLYTLR
jgi:hypothetical protein